MIRRLNISGFRSIAAASLDLAGLTVLVGGNNTGKTNTLHAIRFLHFFLQRNDVPNQKIPWKHLLRVPPQRELRLEVVAEPHGSSAEVTYELSFRVQGGTASLARERVSVSGATHIERNEDGWTIVPNNSPPTTKPAVGRSMLPLFPRDPSARGLLTLLSTGVDFCDPFNSRSRDPLDLNGAGVTGTSDGGFAALADMVINAPNELKAVVSCLRQISPDLSDISVRKVGPRSVPIIIFTNGRRQPLETWPMSSGFRHVLLVLVALHRRPSCPLLLLDEPDAFLFPRTQQMLAEQLITRAARGDMQIVATSHSQVLLNRISASSLRAIRMENGETIISAMERGVVQGVANDIAHDIPSTNAGGIVSFDKRSTPRHGPDFTTVRWYGEEFHFDHRQQAKAIAVLWEAWADGGFGVHESTIADRIKSANLRFRLCHLFREHPAWGTMIQRAEKRGCYRLADPPGAESPKNPPLRTASRTSS